MCICVCVIIDLYIIRHFVGKILLFSPKWMWSLSHWFSQTQCFCLSKNVLLVIFGPSSSDWSKNLARRLSGWESVLFCCIKTRPRCSTRTLPVSGIQLVLWHQLISHYLYLTSKTRKNWPRGRKLLISHHVFHGFANASRTFKHEPKQKTLLWSL